MRFPSLDDGKTSKVQIDFAVHNVQGASITTGFPAIFTTTAASADGRKVVLPATNNTRGLAGVAIKDIPNNEAGLVRAYGWLDSVAIYAHGTSVSIAANDPLGVGPASLGFGSTGLLHGLGPLINMTTAGAAITSPGGYTSAFIKAL